VPGVWYGVGAIGTLGTDAGAPAGEAGVVAKSDPLGGNQGIAGTPGKENISAAGGNCGAPAQGPAVSPSTEEDGEFAIAGEDAEVGNWGMSAVTPASEAAIARKSFSFNALVGIDERRFASPGTEPEFGTAGKENISRW
jgi:hypothetical protein